MYIGAIRGNVNRELLCPRLFLFYGSLRDVRVQRNMVYKMIPFNSLATESAVDLSWY
jgi:hypothetical protein